MAHATAVIGLGVMGQRMLANMQRYPGFDVVAAFDPDAVACEATRSQYPDIDLTASARAAIERPDVTAVYIACPPAWHAEHVFAAIDAGKAVYCEKPLDVDVDRGGQMVERARARGIVNIVNFSLASALAVAKVERALEDGTLGHLAGVDVRVHFARWPRDWQTGAADWLSFRAEGGFTREVLSHWVYLTERLFGTTTLMTSDLCYPPAATQGPAPAETHLVARLQAGAHALPVTIAGSVGGEGPDLVEYTVWGDGASARIHDWNRLQLTADGVWVEHLRDVADPREAGYRAQLANAAAAVAGEPHSMPDFAQALRVQRIIEAMLQGAPEEA